MRNYSIVLGGLESSYMKKLALYLKERLDLQVQVEISRERAAETGKENDTSKIWVGSEKFLLPLQDTVRCRNFIVLTEEDEEDETHVFRYQSCEKLYRAIWMRCRQILSFPNVKTSGRRQHWLAVTTDGSVGELLAFSVVCAQLLGAKANVLYVNLSECCGMEELFSLERDMNLSELFLDLRRGKELYLESYVGRLEQTDYLMPVDNPMILHEIDTAEMNRFLQLIRNTVKYEWIVFAVGNTFCGCEQIFVSADRMFHLTGNGIVNSCVRNAWTHFVRQCRNMEDAVIEQIPMPQIHGESCGSYLLYEWMEGAPGRLAEKYLEERGG